MCKWRPSRSTLWYNWVQAVYVVLSFIKHATNNFASEFKALSFIDSQKNSCWVRSPMFWLSNRGRFHDDQNCLLINAYISFIIPLISSVHSTVYDAFQAQIKTREMKRRSRRNHCPTIEMRLHNRKTKFCKFFSHHHQRASRINRYLFIVNRGDFSFKTQAGSIST